MSDTEISPALADALRACCTAVVEMVDTIGHDAPATIRATRAIAGAITALAPMATAKRAAEATARHRAHIAEMERAKADARDAARYRWLRSTTNFVTSQGERIDVRGQPELWDGCIDAAIAAQPQPDGSER